MHASSLSFSATANMGSARIDEMPRTNVRTKVVSTSNECAEEIVRTSVRFTATVMQILHRSIKVKVPQIVADQVGVCKRTVEHWIKGDRAIGTEEIFRLYERDDGVAILEAYWECIPEVTRERFMQQEILRRRLAARDRARAEEDRELEQLQMALQTR
jgi:hypothetical protein